MRSSQDRYVDVESDCILDAFLHRTGRPCKQMFYSLLMQGTFKQSDTPLLENHTFIFSAFMSASLRLLSLLLYQSAIQLAPLSSTVPYLSLSPAMLLVTAYLLIGEQPSWPGLVGVMIVTLGGYLLAFSSASPNPKKSDERTPSDKVAPVIEQDESIMGLEMGSKLLIMSDTGAKKGLAGVVVCLPTHTRVSCLAGQGISE